MISFVGGVFPIESLALIAGLTLAVLLAATCSGWLILSLNPKVCPGISGTLPVRITVGLLAILSLCKLLALLTGSFALGLAITAVLPVTGTVLLIVSTLRHVSTGNIKHANADWRDAFGIAALAAVLAIVLVKVTPYSVESEYNDLAVAIRESNSVPLINRHFGQSLLAALTLFGNIVNVQTARVAINAWLMVSLVLFASVVYVILRYVVPGRLLHTTGTYIFLFSTASLAITPMIIYDHDFPYVFNVYADSLLGLSAALIALFVAFDESVSVARRCVALACIGMAFTSIAEFDLLAVVVGIAAIIAKRWVLDGRRPSGLLVGGVFGVLIISGVAGSLQGGIFMPASWYKVTTGSAGIDNSASDLQTSGKLMLDLATAYVPVHIPGIWLDFGNLPTFPIYGPRGDYGAYLYNNAVLEASRNEPASTRPLVLLNLIQVRLVQGLQTLFIPLAGAAIATGFLLRNRASDSIRGPSPLTDLAAAAVALIVVFVPLDVFINLPPGLTDVWKWALTRFIEVPVAVSSLFLLTYVLKAFTSTLRTTTLALAAGLLATAPSWLRIYLFVRGH